MTLASKFWCIDTWGVFRIWGHIWAVLCLTVGLWTLTYVGFRWLVLPAFCWIVGHVQLFLLAQQNDMRDAIIGAIERYDDKGRYDAS